MGYLNRMGFFDHLSSRVEVFPKRPINSSAKLLIGTNTSLVEIASINKNVRDYNLPSRMEDALLRSCENRVDAKELGQSAWMIFAELIDNVLPTARLRLMAMQHYKFIHKEIV